MKRVPGSLLVLAATVLVVAPSCSETPSNPPPAASSQVKAAEPLFDGLGSHTRKVTTSSPEAQAYFDQGLDFLFGFNHDEAIRSFTQATELDPGCAMAWWGIAYANGPHINNPVVDEAHAKAAWSALQKAREAAPSASPVEQDLIEALSHRYADPQPDDRKPLDTAFADAMRAVHESYPDDADVHAIWAESMMDLRPWDLWAEDGSPQPGTELVVSTLEDLLAAHPDHPLGNHLYIHAVEASPTPGRAKEAADRLRDMQPGLGHMVHMPSHIDVRLGTWAQAATANRKAIEADRAYRAKSPVQGFYRLYMAHDHHMLSYAAMMQGRSEEAIAAIREMVDGIPIEWAKKNAWIADGFLAMPYEVLMRFGKWEEILAEPEPPVEFPLARALRLSARGVSYAAMGKIDEARAEQKEFLEAAAAVPEDAVFGNNASRDIISVAGALLDGEILYRDGDVEKGLARMRDAVAAEDRLRYDEPPDWIQPVRHALGAALLQAGQAAEAEQVYREDLVRHPHNGWSLLGLHQSLRLQKKADEAAQAQAAFDAAWADADIELHASCFCQPGV